MTLLNRVTEKRYGLPRRRLSSWLGIVLAALVLSILVNWPVTAQLQQSGGGGSNASVGSTGAAAPTSATLAGGVFNTTLPTVTSGNMTGLQTDSSARLLVGSIAGALPAGSNSIGTVVLGAGSASIGSLAAGSSIIGKTVPATACGTTVASQALAAVPTAATAVFTATTCVIAIVMNNTNATATSVTVTDNQATPINDVLTFSIPGNSQLVQPLYGVAFTSGVKWNASAAGVTGGIIGVQ